MKTSQKEHNLLGIDVKFNSIKNNLEKISLYLNKPAVFFHIVSINPENVVIAQENTHFKKVLSEGDIQLMDGIGIQFAGKILGISARYRSPGVDFMENLISLCGNRSLRVLFLGGRGELAEELAHRYQAQFPQAYFKGTQGITRITRPSSEEEVAIFSLISKYKPNILFVAFGSPQQELWLNNHRDRLNNIICMGVGGGFDFLSNKVTRAPKLIRDMGFEWLYRLISQPWRIKRQLRLFTFIYLVIKERIRLSLS
jgi:N-acetylglucosaminyldiphosphoundecaprenol N-acetyl-beta-D-mannosaminyltransferase